MDKRDIIRAENVVKILGDRVILYDASFEIKRGEIFGIIGPSGSGKTTLLRLMIGFFTPEKGDILVRSALVPGRQHELFTSVPQNTDAVKQVFGFASQHPSVYMDLTAEENLRYFGRLHGIPAQEVDRTTDILISLMDLQEARQTLAKNLSGGMQRRLDLACAMIHRPKVLILDEPTADLDPFLRRHIWDIIRKINEQGTTVVVSSHILADVEQICHRVAIVHQGKILAQDTPENIKRRFLQAEHIRLQTYPGRYKKLLRMLEHASIMNIEEVGQELLITTSKTEDALKHIISTVEDAKERLTSIKVEGRSLDEVFLQLAEDHA